MSTRDTFGARVDHLFELADIALNPSIGISRKLELIFELERDFLDLPYAFVTQIDQDRDTQEILAARGTHPLLQYGTSVSLSESYCRKTIETDEGCLWVDDAPAESWADDPAYETFQLGSYIGATVEIEPTGTGTFCFAGTDPRDEEFTQFERNVVRLLARWLTNELHQTVGVVNTGRFPTWYETPPSLDSDETLGDLLRLLADTTRRQTLRLLAASPHATWTASALAQRLDAPKQESDLAVELRHNHLPKLQEAGTIEYEPATGEIQYRPNELVEYLLAGLPEPDEMDIS